MTNFPPDVVSAICRHMDEDHAAGALLIAQTLGGAPTATAARTTDVDGHGLQLTVTLPDGEQVLTVPFAAPVEERPQVRAAVVELHERALACGR